MDDFLRHQNGSSWGFHHHLLYTFSFVSVTIYHLLGPSTSFKAPKLVVVQPKKSGKCVLQEDVLCDWISFTISRANICCILFMSFYTSPPLAYRSIGSEEVFDKRTMWDPKCLLLQLVTQINYDYFKVFFFTTSKFINSVHTHWSSLGGCDFCKNLESTWKYRSKPSSSSPIAPPQLLSSFVQFCWGQWP